MMKRGKRLTREQKECVSAHHLNAKEWSFVKETEFYLYIVKKGTKQMKSLDKFTRTKKRRGSRDERDNAGKTNRTDFSRENIPDRAGATRNSEKEA